MNRTRLFAVCGVVLLALSGTAIAANLEPEFEAYTTSDALQSGSETQFRVNVLNVGDDTAYTTDNPGTAEAVRVTLHAQGAPITVEEGTVPIGSVPVSGSVPAAFDVRVDEDAGPGTYDVELEIEYAYQSTQYNRVTRTERVDTELEISDDARFSIADTNSDVAVGDSGTLSLSLSKRIGGEMRDVEVTVQSRASTIGFSGGASATRYVGTWSDKTPRNVTFDVSASASATPRATPVDVTVSYTDANGIEKTAQSLTTTVIPQSEQGASLTEVSSSLRVDSEGSVSGTLVNDGPERLNDAVVSLSGTGIGISSSSPEFAIGSLDPGDTADFSFELEATEEARAGPRQFDVTVAYRNGEGEQRQIDTLTMRADIAERQPVFSVEAVNNSIPVGGSHPVELAVTNNGDEPLDNINAQVFVDSPVSTDTSDVYIPSLGAGETTTVAFDVSVADGAAVRPRPLELDFQYDEPDGDTRLSDTYQVPLELTSPEDEGGFPMGLLVGVIVIALAIGGVAYRQTR